MSTLRKAFLKNSWSSKTKAYFDREILIHETQKLKNPLKAGLTVVFSIMSKHVKPLDGADGETRTLTPRGART